MKAKKKNIQSEEIATGEIKEGKKLDLLSVVSIIIVIGLIIFAGFLFVKYISKSSIEIAKDPRLKVTELHRQNIDGKLSPEEGYIFNKYSFVRFSDRWHTQVKKDSTIYEVQFYFDPKSVQDTPITGKIDTAIFSNSTLYISIDPNQGDKWMGLAVADTSLTMTKYMGIYPISACSKNETSACEYRDVVNCDSEDKAVIYYSYGNKTEVLYDGNCIRITGSESNHTEIIKAADRFLYDLYNIME